jgi:hypothetical protein
MQIKVCGGHVSGARLIYHCVRLNVIRLRSAHMRP